MNASSVTHRRRSVTLSLLTVMLSWLWFVSLFCGCSDEQIEVKGTVRLNGAPVSEGSIIFRSVDGTNPETGASIKQGAYALKGKSRPLPGKKAVHITAARPTGRKIPAGSPSPPGTFTDEIEFIKLPPQTCEITAAKENEISFDLSYHDHSSKK